MELYVDIEKKLPGFHLKVSFDTKQDPLGFLGASGSGKSMTLRCIAGLETPTKGRIVLNDRVLFDSEKKINLPSRSRKIGFLFQNYALFPHMTVEGNIGFALKGLSKQEKKDRVAEKIKMVRLEGFEKRYPWELSGGQQQRVALARALAMEPEALLLDEPFSALDNHLRSVMEKQLIEILSEYKGVTLFVTHNIEEAYRVCKDILVFSSGKIVGSGCKDALFQRPPTFDAARLTGCKNLSQAVKISEDMIQAKDWACKLQVDTSIPSTLAYVGIRANNLVEAKSEEEVNTFPCWVSHISESPFRVTAYLSLTEPSEKTEVHHLQWDLSKEKWNELLKRPQPWYIHIDPKKLFLTE